jgi:hypothetical protein
VIFDEPHPLHFGPQQIDDYFSTALRWIAAAHAQDRAAIYPIITWNCLPKSGATLMHGHMQIALAHGMHYARAEAWRRAAETYRATSSRSYFDDLFAIHAALGLSIPSGGDLRIFAHLTPARNREIVCLAPGPMHDGAPNKHLLEMIALILRRMIADLGTRAFNLALILPPIGPAAENWCNMPLVVRIGDRGNPLTDRSDVGAMELFVAGCITADPFEVAAALQIPDETRRPGDKE